ncbi:MAG: glycosyltransferase family 4 protein [Candidatus Helarchaeota archaeon]
MIRVAMVVFSYYPGDVRVRRVAEALADIGISPDIICLRNNKESKSEIINGVKVYRLPLRRKRGRKFSYFWSYASFIFLSFFVLTKLYIKSHYNLIHVHNMPDVLVFSAIIPKLFGSKIILDLHDPMPEVYMAKYSIDLLHPVIRLLIFLEKSSIRFSDHIITPNIAFRNLFISRGCPESKIDIIMNSPDEKIFFKLSESNRNKTANNNEFRIMYHGTIVERHGLDLALKALNKVQKKIPNITFHVFGEGDFVEPFLELIKKLKLKDIVFYHGQVPHETIPKEIELSDLGLVPNRKNPFTNINMPTRIFEYLCKGKPVIVPRTKGILDYFDDNSLCFFEPGDEDDLANKIIEIYIDSIKHQHVLEKGILVYKKYCWKNECRNFINLVTKLSGN